MNLKKNNITHKAVGEPNLLFSFMHYAYSLSSTKVITINFELHNRQTVFVCNSRENSKISTERSKIQITMTSIFEIIVIEIYVPSCDIILQDKNSMLRNSSKENSLDDSFKDGDSRTERQNISQVPQIICPMLTI